MLDLVRGKPGVLFLERQVDSGKSEAASATFSRLSVALTAVSAPAGLGAWIRNLSTSAVISE